MSLLAIDQGTTSTRAIVVEADGSARLLASFTHAQSYPHPGRVEHDAEELLAHVRACLDAAQGEGVEAVGIANQGESCLAWDAATGAPLGPVIVWQDARTIEAVEALRAAGHEAAGHEAAVRATTGLPLDPYFSASKLGWLLRETPGAPALAAAGRLRLGTTDAFFRDRLTGRFETDASTASRTALMDLSTGQWSPAMCALFGVPMGALPAITATTGDLGRIGALRLAASVVDQQAALYGHGCRAPGEAKITFGTGAFALMVSGAARPHADGPLPTVAWQLTGAPLTYALDGGVYAASSAVNWARGLGLFDDWAQIDTFAAPPAISRGLVFVPALAGLACPHWDRAARGAWLGMGLDTSRADLMQALLEGVALRMAEVMAAMPPAPAAPPVAIDGGMTANAYFCQFLADVLARPVRVAAAPECTGLGTAALAAQGAGLPLTLPQGGRLIAPRPIDPAWHGRFAAARAAVQGFALTGPITTR
ncbi:MAG: glycerol kinase [Rhodobacterales bacterium]|nr:glycerol kinase [Rhodobacterales bacterium]